MDAMTPEELGEPEVREVAGLRVVGLSGEYTMEQTVEIPKQWGRLNAALDENGWTGATYAVVSRTTPMRYVSGVEVGKLKTLPDDWVEVEVPAQRYAVFAHKGGVEVIRRVWMGLGMHWMEAHKGEVGDGPMVEYYAAMFGMGDDRFEIWVPLRG